MLLQQFQQKRLSCSDTQLLIAIVLDELGYKDASRIVSEQKLPFTDYELEERYKDDIIVGMINFFFETELFPVKVGKLNINKKLVTLKELCSGIFKDEVIKAAYRTACMNSKDNLICLFYGTTLAKESFFHFVKASKNVSYDGRKNILSDDVLNTIYVEFMKFFNASPKSNYNTSSRTPIAYMRHTYDSFFNKTNSNTGKNPVNEILNLKSLDNPMGNSEQNLALIDFIDLEENDFNNDSINFIELASKINKASNFLFNNRNSSEAFYDIFSWYRDRLFENQFKESRVIKNLGNVKRFERFRFRTVREISDFDTTTRNKYNARNAICEQYLPLIEESISTEDIFELYKVVVRTSVDVLSNHKKDGTAHYTYEDKEISVNASKTGKNCDKFRAEYEGFLALRDLLKFINSSANTMGVTVFNMPTDIFRNELLLKRFNSFKQYIIMNDDVKKLVYEIQADSIRNRSIVDGVNSNDRVYNFLAHIPVNKRLLETISQTSLAKGEKAVNLGDNPAQKLVKRVNDVDAHLKSHKIFVAEEFTCRYFKNKRDPKVVAFELVRLCVFIYKNGNDLKSGDIFIYAIRFKNIVKALFSLLGTEIVDSDNYYSLECAICVELERICDTKELFSLITQFPSEVSKQFIDLAYSYFCTFLFDSQEIEVLDILYIRDFFFTMDLIEAIIDGFEKFMKFINGRLSDVQGSNLVTSENLFLLYAEMIDKYKILNLKPCVNRMSDIIFLIEEYNVSPYYLKSSMTLVGLEYAKREKNVLIGVNKYLGLCKIEFKFINALKNDIYKTLGREETSIIENQDLLNQLSNANYNIIVGDQYKRGEFAQKLESMFDFNEFGFITKLDKVFRTNQDGKACFYHRNGYKVLFSDFLIPPDIKELTIPDITELELRFGV